MLKKIKKAFKKILFSFLIIYGFNMVLVPLNINIPLNIINILVVSVLGLPSFLSLIIVLLIAY